MPQHEQGSEWAHTPFSHNFMKNKSISICLSHHVIHRISFPLEEERLERWLTPQGLRGVDGATRASD